MNFQEIIDFLKGYTNNYEFWGIFRLVLDIVLTCGLIFFLVYIVRKKINIYKVLLIILGYFVCYILLGALGLQMLASLLGFFAYGIVILFVVIYNQDLKYFIDRVIGNNKTNNIYTSKEEKDVVISKICETVEYLAERRIGALITFERDDSLSSISQKAIQIDSVITPEILKTIFTPGTSCHDGGVIIRNNRIACAGAYFPQTDNFDIPTFLGTRHRAAIGVSEKYDAITVIVSEETGNISFTISGNISLDITIDRLKELLDSCLNAK